MKAHQNDLRSINSFRVADLEAIRLLLRGGSVIDWFRLNFEVRSQALAFLHAQGFDWDDEVDRRRISDIQASAIAYLRNEFQFPIPAPIENGTLVELLMLASSKGHRQLCACSILKVMHIIHHLDAHELFHTLPISDQDAFQLVEKKVYGTVGRMLSEGFPVVEFIGGRKGKQSLYTKLLSKQDTIAAQIYDKLRFRLVVRNQRDLLPTLRYLTLHIFPFNYVIPGQSKNTLFDFHALCSSHPHLSILAESLQLAHAIDAQKTPSDNRFSSSRFRVIHFVVDIPIRLPEPLRRKVKKGTGKLGPVIFVQVEFQISDQASDEENELGEASHSKYKKRQQAEVMRRLKMGDPKLQNR